MGLTKAQEAEYKNMCKEMVKELLTDKDFMETFCDKIVAIVTKKLTADIDKFKKQVNSIEAKITKMQNDCITLKEENSAIKNALKDVDNNALLNKIDDLEQYSKMPMLRIFGVNEAKDENLNNVLIDIFDKELEVLNCQLEYCYRIGTINKKVKKPRPIVVKFASMIDRNNVFYNKKKLKGKQVSIVEELTNSRYKLLHSAKEKFGKANVWTKGGKLFAKIKGKKYCMKTSEDVEKMSN